MKQRDLKLGILIVNGPYDYRERFWLEISLRRIIENISGRSQYRLFIWNNNPHSVGVRNYLSSFGQLVDVLDEVAFPLSAYDPERLFRLHPHLGGTLEGGFHPHSTPLQILFEHAVASFQPDIIFTFDNDACPIRPNWDVPLVHHLESGKMITGIWRDELKQVIRPYVHPSCLGIKTETIRELGLRFNEPQVFGKLDTLAHFTYSIVDRYGEDVVAPLRRDNRLQYHPVFNGVYGGLVYHHHLGTRNREGTSKFLRTYGWKERNEEMQRNRLVMDATTEMLFRETDDFLNSLAYGEKYLDYRIYAKYFQANPSKFRAMKLFHHARRKIDASPGETFFILTLLFDELGGNDRFIDLYVQACERCGYVHEAAAYRKMKKA